MSETKIVVIGGGMAGLAAAAAFAGPGVSVTIVDPSPPGGVFAQGGFKYFHDTPDSRRMLGAAELMLEGSVPVRGGILLDGEVRPYPEWLRDMPQPQAQSIMDQHYAKTRGGQRPVGGKAMNDPFGDKPGRLIFDPAKFIKGVLKRVTWLPMSVTMVTDEYVSNGSRGVAYDFLINTLDVRLFAHLARRTVPELVEHTEKARTTDVTIFRVITDSDRLAGFDYIYTPFTHNDTIHRVSRGASWYDCETAKPMGKQLAGAFSDIGSIFSAKPLVTFAATIPGHVCPFEGEQAFTDSLRDHWIMVGRFASWDGRCTVDKAFRQALDAKIELL